MTTDFQIGEPVTWLWTPRGGYGYTQTVVARVLGATAKRIRIAALLANGDEEIRTVKPENLRHNPTRRTNAERLKRQGEIFNHSGICGKIVL